MLAQAVMPVVIALTEEITLGTQECVTAKDHLKVTMVEILKVPQWRSFMET